MCCYVVAPTSNMNRFEIVLRAPGASASIPGSATVSCRAGRRMRSVGLYSAPSFVLYGEYVCFGRVRQCL